MANLTRTSESAPQDVQQPVQPLAERSSFRSRLASRTRVRFTAIRNRVSRRRAPRDQQAVAPQLHVRFQEPPIPKTPPNPPSDGNARQSAPTDDSSRSTTPRDVAPNPEPPSERPSEPTPRRMFRHISDHSVLGSSVADITDDRYVPMYFLKEAVINPFPERGMGMFK